MKHKSKLNTFWYVYIAIVDLVLNYTHHERTRLPDRATFLPALACHLAGGRGYREPLPTLLALDLLGQGHHDPVVVGSQGEGRVAVSAFALLQLNLFVLKTCGHVYGEDARLVVVVVRPVYHFVECNG